MKKLCIILLLSIPCTAYGITPTVFTAKTLRTIPIFKAKKVLSYHNLNDIHSPKKRSGQYQRRGKVAGEKKIDGQPTQLVEYYFGEYIDKETREQSIAIEESPAPKEPIHKIIPGCSRSRIGYIKNINNKTVSLYDFNPYQGNLEALLSKEFSDVLKWAKH